MSHPLVAAVWEQLRRRDITNILREIIGEHATEIATFQAEDASDAKTEHLLRSVFWIKAIFDLQRAYLQGLTSFDDGNQCSPPYLLPAEVVFSTLMYLVQVKPKLFPWDKPASPELVRYRQSLALALLAGARLLLLRGESIQFEMKFNLERAIRSAWQDPELPSAERFLVNNLLSKVIESIDSSDSMKGHIFFPASGGGNPKFVAPESYHPFLSGTETRITDLLTALLRNNTDQLTPFLSLFDMLWATESTMVQSHIDRRRISQEQGHILSAALNVDESFDRARESRMKLARTVLAAFDDEFTTPPLQILATVVLSQNAEGQPPLQTRRIRDTWAQLSRIREVCEGSLNHLVRWLINRRVQLWGCNGELEAVSHDYQQNLTYWLQNSPLQEGGQPHYELLVFKKFGLSPEAHLPIEIHHPSLPPIHMIMSRDDKYVAFTLKSEVRVYEIIQSGIRRVSFGGSGDTGARLSEVSPSPTPILMPLGGGSIQEPEQEGISERKLQFSVDGKYFVIATHLIDDNAYVDVWDFSLKRWDTVPGRSTSFRLSHRTNNKDLTCVFYDTVHHAVLLPAFFEREFPISSSITDKDTLNDARIIHAAQSPSGSQFAIANGMNQIYLFDSKASGALRVSRMKKASHKISSSVFRPGYLTLSFPQDDEVLLFWMDSGKLMLRSVRLLDGTQTSKDYDLRSDFDRLMLERPAAADAQLRRSSLLSNQQSTGMDGFIPVTSRPKLAELAST
ncbi:hypothetical protein BBP40_005514 [Aspergillus hancockii]|nr:hypothetical protein BBP40_005514 [Aspergillus hancockii]